VPPVLSVRQNPPNRGWVTGKLVGDHHARRSAVVAGEYLTQESLGRLLITSALHQDVEHNAGLVNSSPQPVLLTADLQQDLVQVPLVAGAPSSSSQSSRKGSTELGAPLADRFVADDDAALGEEILHVAEAEMEPEVEPDSVGDDLRRKTVAAVRRSVGSRGGHQLSLIADARLS